MLISTDQSIVRLLVLLCIVTNRTSYIIMDIDSDQHTSFRSLFRHPELFNEWWCQSSIRNILSCVSHPDHKIQFLPLYFTDTIAILFINVQQFLMFVMNDIADRSQTHFIAMTMVVFGSMLSAF
jgi:hypothetical protein